jgi:fibronectin-binding autotransporter adhesin
MTGQKKLGKMNRKLRSYRTNWKIYALLCAATGLGIAQRAQAQTSNWTGGASTAAPASGNWSVSGNWDTAPISSTTTILGFAGSGSTAYTSTDDIAGAFTLNQITLSNTSTVTDFLNASTGSSLNFSAGGIISQIGTAGFQINAPINISNGNLTISGTGGTGTTLGGSISGTSGINYTNSVSGEYLRLTGTNTFSGGVTASSGTYIYIASPTALGTGTYTALGTTTLNSTQITASNTIANAMVLPSSGTLTLYTYGTSTTTTYSGNISGGTTSSELYLNTTSADVTGIYDFSNPNSTFVTSTSTTGAGIQVNRGSLKVDTANGLGNASNGVYLDSYGNQSLIFGGSFTYTHPTYFTSLATYFNTSTNTVTASGVISGSAVLTKNGAGILTLLATNTYTGATNVAAGALVLGTTSAVVNWTTPGHIQVSSGAILAGRAGNATDFSSANLDTLRAFPTYASGSYFGIDTTDGNFTYNSNIGSYNTAIGFAKLGANTLTLNPVESYTGPTTVIGGVLNYNVSNSLTGNLSVGYATASAAISLPSGVTLTSNGTLSIVGYNSTYVTNITGPGTLALRNPSSTSTSPDITYNAAFGAPYGSVITSTVDVGTGNRFITGNSARNDVARYAGDLQFSGPITGSATLNFIGAVSSTTNMSFVLNANNSGYTGPVTINDADLVLTNSNALNSVNSLTFADSSASTRASLFLFGNNVTIGSLNDTSVTGSTRWIRNGSLVAANGGTDTSGGGGSPLGLNASSTLTVNQTVAGTFGGVISDGPNDTGTGVAGTYNTLGITKTGSANLALTGASNYSGATIVNAGRLEVDGSLGAGSLVAVNSTGTLAGIGTVTGAVTINNHGTLEAGNSGVGTLTLGSLTLGTNSGDVSTINVTQLGTIAVNGSLTLTSGATSTINVGGGASGFTTGGSYPLVTYNGTALSSLSGFSLGTLPPRVLGSLVESTSGSANSINLSVTGVDFPVWTGAKDGNWVTSPTVTTGEPDDWVLNSNNATTTDFVAGDSVLFSNLAGAGHTTVNINSGDVFPGNVVFNTSLNYTLSGANGINGSTGLFVSGGGSLTINNVNSFTGNVNISNATVNVATITNSGVAGALGAGTTLALSNGTLSYTGSSASNTRNIALGTGGGTINVSNSGTTLSLAGNVTGASNLTVAGPGTLALTAANTGFTGPIVVNSGSNLSVGADTELGAVPASATPAAITLNGTGTLTTNASFSLSANRGITGSGSVVVSNSTLTLNNSNSYTGGTTILGTGLVTLNSVSGLGTGPIIIGTASTSGYFLYTTGLPAATEAIANNIVLPNDTTPTSHDIYINGTAGSDVQFTGNISGGSTTSELFLNTNVASGAGIFEFSGNNNFSAGTTSGVYLNRGTLQVDNANALGNASNGVQLDSYSPNMIIFGSSFTYTHPTLLTSYASSWNTGSNTVTATGAITGTVGLVKIGSGTLIMTGSNGYSSSTTVTAGTLQVGNGGTLGFLPAVAASVASGATLVFNRSDTVTFGNVISGTGSVTQMGPGTLILTATNTFTGATTVSGGTLEIDGVLASGSSVAVNANGTLTGVGAVGGPVNLNNGGAIGSKGILSVGGLTFGASSSDTASVNMISSLTNSNPTLGQIDDTGALTVNSGSNTITVNVAGITLPTGDYPLIEYNGSVSSISTISQFKLGTLPSGVVANLYNNTANDSIDLNVTAGDFPKWTGALNSEWVTTPQSAPHNWQLASAGTPTDYADGNSVEFDDSASNFNVDISSENVSPSAVTFVNNSATYTFTGSNGIAGSTGVTMSGSGTVIFANSNTYTGGTTITNGTIQVSTSSTGSSGPLGTGTIRLGDSISDGNSANLFLGAYGSSGGQTLSNPIVVQSGSSGTLTIAAQNTSGINTLTGSIIIGTGSTTQTLTLLAGTGGELDVNGNIGDNGAAGSLVLGNGSNTGTIKLNGTNSYTGSTTVNGGTVMVNSLGGVITLNNSSTVVAGNTVVAPYNNELTINGGSTYLSTGTITLQPPTSNTTSVNGGGTLELMSTTASLTKPDLTDYLPNYAYYAVEIANPIVLGAGNHYIVGSSGDNAYGQHTVGDLTLQNSLSGPGNLTVSGAPYIGQFEVVLEGDDSQWTGNLTIARGNVALPSSSGNALTVNNNVSFTPASGQVAGLYLFGQNITIGNLSGTGAGSMYIRNGSTQGGAVYGSNSTLTVIQTVNSTFAGVISDGPNDYNAGTASTYPLGLTLAGTANLTLTGSNTYTGDTDINSGTLTLGTTGALGATHINVNTGASLVFATTPGSGTVVRSLPGALSINSGAVVTLATSAAVADHQIISTASFSNSGLLDLGNGALDVPGSTGYQTISNQIQTAYNGGAWNGTAGITSTAAANNTTHLTTLGVIVNDDGTGTNTPLYGFGGTIAGTFSTLKPADGDILVKYTYYGDTNLDGKVDGTDYSRIDNSYEQENWVNGVETGSQVTGWYNGDFNYDGNVDGSDYTLIDNAFNSQGASLASLIASPDASATAQIAGGSSAVPEPTSLGLLGIAAAGLLGRRRRR